MKKKIVINQLKPGMFIDDFNCEWMDRPFFSNSMKVDSEDVIEKIIDYGIHELYIDTEKGLDAADAPTVEEAKKQTRDEMIRGSSQILPKNRDTVPLHEELIVAQEIKQEAKQTIRQAMEDIRMGRQIEIKQVDSLVDRMVESVSRNQNALSALGRVKTVHEYTFHHCVTVGVLLISFAMHLDHDYETIKLIGLGGMLHDIGKSMVPVELLNKASSLTKDEFQEIKKHVVHSRKILEEQPGIRGITIDVAAQHHERYDGKGYPDGLKGDEISVYGQMSSIIDVYDALTSKRCYHNSILPTEALRKLYEWSKFHFNRDLVQQFICCVGIYPVGTLVRLESGLLGVVTSISDQGLLYPSVRVIYDTKKNRYLEPIDIDLSIKADDSVVNYEPPEKWGITPENYL